MELGYDWVGLALMTPGVARGLPMIVIAHTTLPNSAGPILFLVVFPAVAEGVVQGAGVTQTSKAPDCNAMV
jgi:hypothetical protein